MNLEEATSLSPYFPNLVYTTSRKSKRERTNMEKYRATHFQMDCIDNSYPGFTDGTKWSGWECPYFTKETALQLAKDLKTINVKCTFNEEQKAFILDEGYEDGILTTVTVERITYNKEEIEVYDIGSGYWVWSEDKTDSSPTKEN